jgi:hypothetical protein
MQDAVADYNIKRVLPKRRTEKIHLQEPYNCSPVVLRSLFNLILVLGSVWKLTQYLNFQRLAKYQG